MRITVRQGTTTSAPHFWATRPRFPAAGCWRITATSGRARLTFTVKLERAPD
jgi:hypothetical protein